MRLFVTIVISVFACISVSSRNKSIQGCYCTPDSDEWLVFEKDSFIYLRKFQGVNCNQSFVVLAKGRYKRIGKTLLEINAKTQREWLAENTSFRLIDTIQPPYRKCFRVIIPDRGENTYILGISNYAMHDKEVQIIEDTTDIDISEISNNIGICISMASISDMHNIRMELIGLPVPGMIIEEYLHHYEDSYNMIELTIKNLINFFVLFKMDIKGEYILIDGDKLIWHGTEYKKNNQQNALPNGLGGVSLQTYEYDAMNRLTHSSVGNSDAGVSYHFSQTYSPSGRIGDKFCDFTHSDHLGSSSWTTDASGKAIQHIEYLPFGEEFVNQRTTSYEDRYTFTGKELDAESNLYYYDARYNSSTYSQFTSPDPMSDKYPSVSPYLYCAGNPIMYVDPNGMVIAIEDNNKTYTFEERDGEFGFYCEEKRLNNDFATEADFRKGKFINWNSNMYVESIDVYGNYSSCKPYISLAHEMAHIVSRLKCFGNFGLWKTVYGEHISNDEKWATFVENLIRIENGIDPRAFYHHIEDIENGDHKGYLKICERKRGEIIHIYPMFDKFELLSNNKK